MVEQFIPDIHKKDYKDQLDSIVLHCVDRVIENIDPKNGTKNNIIDMLGRYTMHLHNMLKHLNPEEIIESHYDLAGIFRLVSRIVTDAEDKADIETLVYYLNDQASKYESQLSKEKEQKKTISIRENL